MVLSIISLLISLIALALAIKNYRHGAKKEMRERHVEILDAALELETTLSVLYSNVLTTDKSNHCEQVTDVIERAITDLPAIIASTQALCERIRESHDMERLEDLELLLRTQRAEARALAEMIAHGIERGRIA
jgi:hypothetical protein